MTLEEKQTLNIDRTLLLQFLRTHTDLYDKGLESEFVDILKDFIDNLPKETTLPNDYQAGYQKGREDMKKEIIEKQNKDRETYNEWTCVEAYDYEFDESLLSTKDTK